MENRVKPWVIPTKIGPHTRNTAYFSRFMKTPFDIMGVGPEETNARGDALIENEIRLHLAMRLRGRGYGAIPTQRQPQRAAPHGTRVRLDRTPLLHRPLLARARRARRMVSGRPLPKEESHRLPAIALTRIIPSPCHASRGFGETKQGE